MPGASQQSDHLRIVADTQARSEADDRVRAEPEPGFLTRWRELEARGAERGERIRLVFAACHAMVFSIASRITGSPWDAEDVTQSVFEQLARRLDEIRHPAAIPSFVKTLAVRVSLRHVRRDRWRRARLKVAFAASTNPLQAGPEAATSVRQILAQLPPEERAAVVLRYVEMHGHAEIAALMGVSSATARRRLAAGRERLVALLGEQGVETMFGKEGPR